MNKKAILSKEVLELIIAAAGIFLIALLFFQLLAPSFDKELESAKSIMKNILEKANELKEGEIDNYPVMDMGGWSLIYFDKSLMTIPKTCSFRKDCLCICEFNAKIDPSESITACNKKGICETNDKIKTAKTGGEKYDSPLAIPLYEDNTDSITKTIYFYKKDGIVMVSVTDKIKENLDYCKNAEKYIIYYILRDSGALAMKTFSYACYSFFDGRWQSSSGDDCKNIYEKGEQGKWQPYSDNKYFDVQNKEEGCIFLTALRNSANTEKFEFKLKTANQKQ